MPRDADDVEIMIVHLAHPRSKGFGVNIALLGVVLALTIQRLQRAAPALDVPLSGDAHVTYLPSARKLLDAPWTFLTSDPQSYAVAPLSYFWPALLGADQGTIQFANGLLFLISLVLLWDLARRLGGHLAAFVTVALLAFHPEITDYAPQALTEAPYFFGFALSMYAAVRGLTAPRCEPRKRWPALLTLGLTITLLTRPVLQYLLLAGIVALTALTLWKRHRPPADTTTRQAWLFALMLSLALPMAVIVKNGICFDVWSIGTGSGTGLYYGVSPFKNGSEPVYSNFMYDAGLMAATADPETQGNPLDKRSDAINRAVALEIVRQTVWSDNLRFFGLKLKQWLLTSTPDLFIKTKLRVFRLSEWLCIGLFLTALAVRRIRGLPLALPGLPIPPRRKLGIYLLLLALVGLMAVQLTPILYNTRYASYFIEPWLIVLTGLSVAWWVLGVPCAPSRARSVLNIALRLAAVLLLVYVAQLLTSHAMQREAWRLDPYRPGPTALVLPANRFGPLKGDGMAFAQEGTWKLEKNPATLHIPIDAAALPPQHEALHDAMWRLRFALAAPGERPPTSCVRVAVTVQPSHRDFSWYTPPAQLHLARTQEASTYLMSANGRLRPAAASATLSLTFHCPSGSVLTWYGIEMRRSTMPEAARDFLRHGVPIDPYLRTEP